MPDARGRMYRGRYFYDRFCYKVLYADFFVTKTKESREEAKMLNPF